MSTIKISELAEVGHIDTNTSNTLFVGVDLTSGVTAKITATTLAEGLYSHNVLNVGNNEIIFPNTIGQFSGNSETYPQVNLQNFDPIGSSDFVATASTGSDTRNYIDMGINNLLYSDTEYSAFGPLDGYIYTLGSGTESSDGNFIIGTKSKDAGVFFIAGGTETSNIVSAFTRDYIEFARDVYVDGPIIFGDDSSQYVAAAPAGYTQAAFDKANSAYTVALASAGAVTSITGSSPISTSGTTSVNISHNNSGVVPGSYGTSVAIPTFTVDRSEEHTSELQSH